MSDMKTVDIKGKAYVTVNERIKYFREHFEGYSMTSTIIKLDAGIVVIQCSILDGGGVVRASGLAYEKEGSSFINKTSYIENCETSAWGRALANFGIGVDSSVASADEVANAIQQQNKPKKQRYLTSEQIDKIVDLDSKNELEEMISKRDWTIDTIPADKYASIYSYFLERHNSEQN